MGFFDVYDQYILNMLYDPRINGRHDRAGGQGGAAARCSPTSAPGCSKVNNLTRASCFTVIPRMVRSDQTRECVEIPDSHLRAPRNDELACLPNALTPIFSNSSRPISMRRISLVPAPIS